MNQHFRLTSDAMDALGKQTHAELRSAVHYLFDAPQADAITNIQHLEDRVGVLLPAVKDAVLYVMQQHLPSHLFVSALAEAFDDVTMLATQECEMQREDVDNTIGLDSAIDERLGK